jgi:hypothetical protein
MSGTLSPALPGRPLIGAIRWDAWYDPSNGVAAQAVETDLAPAAFLSRAPSFATVNTNGGLTINGDNQAEMTREIQLAHAAGIDYWAFDFYGAGDPMGNALQLYLENPTRAQVDFALIDSAGWGATLTNFQAQIAQRVALMAQPTYQTVEGGRPLYYLMVPSGQIVSQWWGGDAANMKVAVDALRAQVVAAGGGNPYIVAMGGPSQAAAFAQMIGADAISAYAIQGGDQNASYQTLANETMAGWNAELATGRAVVPTVMTGWNPSPRVQNPVPWGSSGTASYAAATPAQIAAQLSSALAWALAHPAAASTALVYAWNEFDEGGWLAPTYVAGNPQGDSSRLAALAAISALYQGATPNRHADGSYSVALGDGSSEQFSSSGALLKWVAADGSWRLAWSDGWLWYSKSGAYLRHEVDLANGGRKFFNAAGHLTETDNPDGTSVIVGGDGSQTFHAANGAVTKIIAADGSSRVAWPDGWLWYDKTGRYVQHEVDLASGGRQFYNAAGHLTEIDNASGAIVKLIAADGSSRVAWSDGWLWFDPQGRYVQHEADLANGDRQFFNAAGHLTETDLADGNVLVSGGAVSVNGGAGRIVFIAPASAAAQIVDQSSAMTLALGPNYASLDLLGLAQDPAWKLDLIGGLGGFGSVQALIAAFHSDGRGGSLLNLPGANIDLAGVAPQALSAAHFQVLAIAPAS